jgi:hypothetical protein
MADSEQSRDARQFVTTRWTIVLTAGRTDTTQAQAALEKLCQTYWYPLYAYVRRHGHSPEDAQDLTQEFFAKLIAKNYLRDVNRSKGKIPVIPAGVAETFPRQRMGQVPRPKTRRRPDDRLARRGNALPPRTSRCRLG